jgi:hypothetical protein
VRELERSCSRIGRCKRPLSRNITLAARDYVSRAGKEPRQVSVEVSEARIEPVGSVVRVTCVTIAPSYDRHTASGLARSAMPFPPKFRATGKPAFGMNSNGFGLIRRRPGPPPGPPHQRTCLQDLPLSARQCRRAEPTDREMAFTSNFLPEAPSTCVILQARGSVPLAFYEASLVVQSLSGLVSQARRSHWAARLVQEGRLRALPRFVEAPLRLNSALPLADTRRVLAEGPPCREVLRDADVGKVQVERDRRALEPANTM